MHPRPRNISRAGHGASTELSAHRAAMVGKVHNTVALPAVTGAADASLDVARPMRPAVLQGDARMAAPYATSDCIHGMEIA